MIIFSVDNFSNIFKNEGLNLPIRWNGGDFHQCLSNHFDLYLDLIKAEIDISKFRKIRSICNNILNTIDYYNKGNPTKSYTYFKNHVMKYLKENPIDVYQKNGWHDAFGNDDPLRLYRVRSVNQDIEYSREDLFHTPYNLRNKVGSCRYSIAGYPCLYLGTSLRLCCEEIRSVNDNSMKVAARFKLRRLIDNGNNRMIYVYDLALKPQDFFEDNENGYREVNEFRRMSSYVMWYPLIVACSVIRSNKNDPFASEYIVPQLLMQWLKNESDESKLYGVRYFPAHLCVHQN